MIENDIDQDDDLDDEPFPHLGRWIILGITFMFAISLLLLILLTLERPGQPVPPDASTTSPALGR